MRYSGIRYRGFPILIVHSGSSFKAGKNITLNSGQYSNLIGTQRTQIILRKGAELKIGDNFGGSGLVIYSKLKISIGDNVKIGSNVKIFDTDFHPLDFEKRRLKNNTDYAQCLPVIIGDDVFIGEGAIILKGSEIGSRSIVGARAVVSGKFAEDSLIVGNPAKDIRK